MFGNKVESNTNQTIDRKRIFIFIPRALTPVDMALSKNPAAIENAVDPIELVITS